MVVVAGGNTNDESGFFVHPTFVETTDPLHRLMREEIFGPVLTAWVYPDADYDRALDLYDSQLAAITQSIDEYEVRGLTRKADAERRRKERVEGIVARARQLYGRSPIGRPDEIA